MAIGSAADGSLNHLAMNHDSPLRLGIVGCGRVAEHCHIPAALAAENVDLTAVVDANPSRLDHVVGSFGLSCAATTSHADLIGRVDAVLLLLPNHLHYPVARELLEAGLHVLCEKPLANTSDEARNLCALAEARGRVLAVGYMKRFEPNFALMARLIADRFLGRLHRFDFEFGSAGGWAPLSGYNLQREQAGGGVLLVNGCHLVDRMLCWFGHPTQIAFEDDAHGGVEANCSATFAFDSGLTGEFRLSKTIVLRNRFRLYGERGCVEMTDAQRESVTYFPAGRPGLAHEIFEHPRPAPLEDAQYFQLQIEDFATAIRSGVPPRVSGREATASIEVIERCYRVRRPLPEAWAFDSLPSLTRRADAAAGVDLDLQTVAMAGVGAAVASSANRSTGGSHGTQLLTRPAPALATPPVKSAASTVLVTGATGFVGGRLCEVLHLAGDVRPRALVHSSGKASYIARYPLEFAAADLTDFSSVRRAVDGCSFVVHLARGSNRVMIHGLENLLRAAVEARVGRFVHVSSVAVYGDNPPQSAESEGAAPRRTGNPYGDVKLEQEKLVESYGRRFGLPFVILRPPHITGPHSHFVSAVQARLQSGTLPIVDGGANVCNLVYIDNLVQAILLALEADRAAGETFFVTDRERVTWRTCLEDLAAIFGVEIPHATADQLAVPDSPGARERLRRFSSVAFSPEFRSALLDAPGLGAIGKFLYRGYALLPEKRRNYVRSRLSTSSANGSSRRRAVRYDAGDYLVASQRRTVVHSCDKAERILGYTAPVGYRQALALTRDWLEFARAI